MDDEVIDVITECSFDYLDTLYEPWNKTDNLTSYNPISPQWLIQLADDWNSEHSIGQTDSRKLKKRLSEDVCDESMYREILNKYKENDVFVLPNGEELVRVRNDSSSESEIDIMNEESSINVGDWQSTVSKGLTKNIDNIPAPTQERHLDSNIITADERYYHPNLFGKRDDKKYLKVRNTIMELWNANKPSYVSKTISKQKLKKFSTTKEIGQVHAYLEHRGYINFGCDECKYRTSVNKEQIEARILKKQYNLKPPLLHRKKKSFKNIKAIGGYTICHEKLIPQREHNYSISKTLN